jgi:nucleoside-diphosphate-sugar epimerase
MQHKPICKRFALEQNQGGTALNIDAGAGVSVLQIVEAVSRKLDAYYVPSSSRPYLPSWIHSVPISKSQRLPGWTQPASSLTNIVASVVSSCQVKPGP